jgi:hypothetical protein
MFKKIYLNEYNENGDLVPKYIRYIICPKKHLRTIIV